MLVHRPHQTTNVSGLDDTGACRGAKLPALNKASLRPSLTHTVVHTEFHVANKGWWEERKKMPLSRKIAEAGRLEQQKGWAGHFFAFSFVLRETTLIWVIIVPGSSVCPAQPLPLTSFSLLPHWPLFFSSSRLRELVNV